MSEPYEIFILIPDGFSQKKAVYGTHEILVELGGALCEDSLLILNDVNGKEFEPEYLESDDDETVQRALSRLSTWPTFGLITYSMPWFMIDVLYEGQAYSDVINVVSLGLLEGGFYRNKDVAEEFYINLSKKLHENFHAKRTIMDWGITQAGFSWEEEIERLKQDRFLGEYKILDLRGYSPSVSV
jgi:hypothetical protein